MNLTEHLGALHITKDGGESGGMQEGATKLHPKPVASTISGLSHRILCTSKKKARFSLVSSAPYAPSLTVTAAIRSFPRADSPTVRRRRSDVPALGDSIVCSWISKHTQIFGYRLAAVAPLLLPLRPLWLGGSGEEEGTGISMIFFTWMLSFDLGDFA